MRSVPLWKIILVALVIIWGVWEVYPSILWYSRPQVEQLNVTSTEIEQMRTQMEELVEQREEAEDRQVQEDLSEEITQLSQEIESRRGELKDLQHQAIPLGLDLKGGVHVVLKVDTTETESEVENQYLVAQVIESLRNRIDNLGVREPLIQSQGKNRILIQMPSITDPAEVLQVIGKTAQLEFRFAREDNGDFSIVYETIAKIDENMPALNLLEKVQIDAPGAIPWIYKEDFSYFQEHLFVKDLSGNFTTQIKEEVKSYCPAGTTLMFGNPEDFETAPGRTFTRRNIYLINEKKELTGGHLVDASVQLDTQRTGEPYVAFALDAEGARIFSRVTGRNVGKHLAIVLDGTVYSAPRIQGKIPGGNGQITGQFTSEEAKLLAVVLRSGALPATVTVEENRIIDPTLGADSVRSGIVAGLCGVAVVIVFMLIYYTLSGVVAIIALALNVLLLAAALAFIPATLTLPGIAGAILIVGMAVDANVLIFERIREEMATRADRAVALVVDRGFGRAFWTIFDANITTLITALVLFQFGTGPVRGFAVTLSLGIIISMFTAIFVGRMIFDFLTGVMNLQKIPIGKLRFFGKADYNLIDKRKIAAVFSIIMIVVGIGYIVIRGEKNLGVDLSSGSSVVLAFDQPVEESSIRQTLEERGLPGVTLYRFAKERNQIAIRMKDIQLPEGMRSAGAYLMDILSEEMPGMQIKLLSDDTVGPTVGRELINKAIWALVFSAIFIIIYIAARFEMGYAIAAVVALFHDVIFSLGIFCLANLIPGQHREINLPIIAALLTIVGYSLNDTIVVFDRIRENRRAGKGVFSKVINDSINQTLSRTVITSLTTLLVVAALFFFGGPGINDFAFTLLIGIIVGTYSSVFIASPVLLWWHERSQKKRGW
jgi:SecD/SecF fusion protein